MWTQAKSIKQTTDYNQNPGIPEREAIAKFEANYVLQNWATLTKVGYSSMMMRSLDSAAQSVGL